MATFTNTHQQDMQTRGKTHAFFLQKIKIKQTNKQGKPFYSDKKKPNSLSNLWCFYCKKIYKFINIYKYMGIILWNSRSHQVEDHRSDPDTNFILLFSIYPCSGSSGTHFLEEVSFFYWLRWGKSMSAIWALNVISTKQSEECPGREPQCEFYSLYLKKKRRKEKLTTKPRFVFESVFGTLF